MKITFPDGLYQIVSRADNRNNIAFGTNEDPSQFIYYFRKKSRKSPGRGGTDTEIDSLDL
jgi:hypothetical protein